MDFITLNQTLPSTDGFFFRSLTNPQAQDALVICNPANAICRAPVVLHSKKSLRDHIQLIKEKQIKKVIVIADNIDFLRECQSIEYLWIIPSFSAVNFDFSPIYDLPNLRWLQCETTYGSRDDKWSPIDYSQIAQLDRLAVSGSLGTTNLLGANKLKTVYFEHGQPCCTSICGILESTTLKKLVICDSPITSLDGIEKLPNIKTLNLAYNKRLNDISALASVARTLSSLCIENCGKIKNFNVISSMKNLEELILIGSNSLPNANFVRNMPHLKSLILKMNVESGDLSMCMHIPYVSIQDRRHYNRKDKDFSKILLTSPDG